MTAYENERFEKQDISVDGNTYVECVFVQCSLIYAGGDLPRFERCTFQASGIQLEGAAAETMQTLKNMNQGGLWSSVAGVIDRVRKGTLMRASRPEPCPAGATGTNYARLGIGVAIMGVIFGLLVLAIWYGMLHQPSELILDAEPAQPLFAEIPLDVMPALPDNLAIVYDDHLDAQEDRLESYGWVDESAGVAHIPLEDAFEMILDEGLPTWSGGE